MSRLFALITAAVLFVATVQAQDVQYVFEQQPNLDAATIHLTEKVSEMIIRSGMTPPSAIETAETRLIRELSKIKGVMTVTLNRYEISVTKGTAFEWDQVMPDFLKTIERLFVPRGGKLVPKKVSPPSKSRV